VHSRNFLDFLRGPTADSIKLCCGHFFFRGGSRQKRSIVFFPPTPSPCLGLVVVWVFCVWGGWVFFFLLFFFFFHTATPKIAQRARLRFLTPSNRSLPCNPPLSSRYGCEVPHVFADHLFSSRLYSRGPPPPKFRGGSPSLPRFRVVFARQILQGRSTNV